MEAARAAGIAEPVFLVLDDDTRMSNATLGALVDALETHDLATSLPVYRAGGNWPSQDDIVGAMVGLSVESLGGKGSWRKDHIADQTFVQGFTTHKNRFDFVTLGKFESMFSTNLQKPAGANFWEWIKTAEFKV